MDQVKKLDVIDLIISILKEHEETLENIATKIENLVVLKQPNMEGKPDWS
jgi:hypothetical protein